MCRNAVALLAALASLCATALPRAAAAQAGSEGLFLLLPVGARAVGMGETVVAQRGGSDLLWWNPAGIVTAGSNNHEVAIHHSETDVGQSNAVAVILSTAAAGTFGFGLNVLDLGRQEVTTSDGTSIGVATPTDFSLGLTYAAEPFAGVTLGATAKHVEARILCSGECSSLGLGGSSSNGLDLGLQVRPVNMPFTIGAAARNFGVGHGAFRPARFDLGADYRVVALQKYTDQVEAHAAAGVVFTPQLDSATVHVGADIVLDQKLHVRVGYIHDPDYASGASVGVGLSSGKLVFDIARTYGGLTANGDKQPTYFSLRYLW